MDLINCKPYAARITERACGLRVQKARILAKRPWVLQGSTKVPCAGLVEVEKCLTCTDARDIAVENDGLNASAAHSPLKKKEEEEKMGEKKACKKCASTEGRVYKGLCAPCRKAAPKTVNVEGFKAVKPPAPTDTQTAADNILSMLMSRSSELKTLHAAALILRDVGGLDIMVPTIEELLLMRNDH